MSPEAQADPRRWLTLALVCTAIFMLLLDVTVVAVALSNIQESFGASLADLQWVIDAYTLPLAALLLIIATTGDRIGRRPVFLIGLVLFTAGSLACAFADSSLQLDLFRAGQGIGGAMLFATAVPILGASFPDPRGRAVAIGIFGATLGSATAVGPIVGGVLVDEANWRWIFGLNVPVGVICLIAGLRWLPSSRADQPRRADWIGAGTFAVTLVCLVLALIRGQDDGWASAGILGLFGLAVVGLVLFVVREVRATEPMLDLGLFRSRTYSGVSLAAFAVSATIIGVTSFIGLYFVNTLGYSPMQAGFRFLPLTVTSFIAGPIGAQLYGRVSTKWLISGATALTAAGLFWAWPLDAESDWTALLGGMIVAGVGLGATSSVLSLAALGSVEPARAGMATGAVNTWRQVGTAIGVAVLGTIFSAQAGDRATAALAGSPIPDGTKRQLADAIGAGAGRQVLPHVPAEGRSLVEAAVREAGAGALGRALLIAAIVAAVSAVACAVLIPVKAAAEEPAP